MHVECTLPETPTTVAARTKAAVNFILKEEEKNGPAAVMLVLDA